MTRNLYFAPVKLVSLRIPERHQITPRVKGSLSYPWVWEAPKTAKAKPSHLAQLELASFEERTAGETGGLLCLILGGCEYQISRAGVPSLMRASHNLWDPLQVHNRRAVN